MKLVVLLTLSIFVCSVLASHHDQDRSGYSDTKSYQRSDDSEEGNCRRDREEHVVSESRLAEDEEREVEVEDEDEDSENIFTIRNPHYEQESHSTESPKHRPQQSTCKPSSKFEASHQETGEPRDDDIFYGQSCHQDKTKESCKKYANFDQENLVSLEDELKAKIQKVALEKELDSLLTLMTLEQQLKDVSQLLLDQEDRLRQQAEKDKKQHAKPQDKQDFEQSCRLKQKNIRSATRDSDKVEQTFIIKSKYRKVSDADADREEERVSKNEKSHSKKSRMQSQKSLKPKSASKVPSAIIRRRSIVKSIEDLVREQKRAESRKEQKVCINRIPKVILSRSDANQTAKKCCSSKMHVQKPSVRSQSSSSKYGKSRNSKPSPKRGNVKVQEIKIEQVKRR